MAISWVDGNVPSILQDRSTLRSRGDTLRRSDTDISPHTAARVSPEDRGPHSCEGKENRSTSVHLSTSHMGFHYFLLLQVNSVRVTLNQVEGEQTWARHFHLHHMFVTVCTSWDKRSGNTPIRCDKRLTCEIWKLIISNRRVSLKTLAFPSEPLPETHSHSFPSTHKAPVYPGVHLHSPVTWWQAAPFWHWHFCWHPFP